MKIILLANIVILSLTCTLHAQIKEHFLVKSGKIEYLFGADYSGTEIFYFDDYGVKEYSLKKMSKKAGGESIKTKTIINRDSLLEIDYKTGIANINHISQRQNTLSGGTQEMLKAGHYKRTGNTEIVGIICDQYEGDMGTLCIWSGIILKSEITIADKKLSKTAIEVDTSLIVPSAIFSIKSNKY